MADPEKHAQGLVLSAEEFEAALRLLEEEEHSGRNHTRQLIFNLAFSLSFAVGALACSLGALIRFVDPAFGQTLLIVGLVAAAVFTLLSTLTHNRLLITSDSIRGALDLGNAPLDASVEAGWRKRTQRTNFIIGVLLVPGAVSILAGLGWLLYSLFALRVVNLLSLVLIAWPVLGLFILTAVRGYQEYAYFSRVAQLRRDFAARLVAARRADEAQVTLSAEEVSQFARVQQRNINTNVRQAVQQYAKTTPELYSVVIEPDAQAALRRLPPETQAALQNRIDALQLDPRPVTAQAATEGNRLILHDDGHTLAYTVDDARQRVTVLSLSTTAGQEGLHGA